VTPTVRIGGRGGKRRQEAAYRAARQDEAAKPAIAPEQPQYLVSTVQSSGAASSQQFLYRIFPPGFSHILATARF
jgi:hypothetical protein